MRSKNTGWCQKFIWDLLTPPDPRIWNSNHFFFVFIRWGPCSRLLTSDHIFQRMFSCTWRKAGILYQFLSNEHNSTVIIKRDNLRSRSKMFYRLWNCIFMLGFHSPQNQCHPSGWNRSQKQKVCGGLAHQIRTVGDAEKGTDAGLSYSKIWSAALWELMCLIEMMPVWRMGDS